MAEYTLERIEDVDAWRKLLSRSPQATRFLDPDLLSVFQIEPRFYGLFRKGVCVMGLPVIDTRPLSTSVLPWCYKQGPVYFDEVFRAAQAKRIQYEVELAEIATTELAKHESWFRFSLHESLTDVRGFDWVHYHDPAKPRCTLLPRYTAVIDLDDVSQDDLRRSARSARRQEEGYAVRREGLTPSLEGSIDELFDLYCTTFAAQNLEVAPLERDMFKPYLQFFLDTGIGQFLTVRDAAGKAVVGAFVFRDVDNIWHVPIVGTGETRYGGTLLYFHILDFVRGQGGRAVDFDGANSPNRAYFKHSIGARPQLYFEVRYEA